ncbi:ThiF family adenylyltransferase [Brevundimonas sp.]|uniref:ThiF family adenylyltransferase n=1 Tax=Brevundimonas sp. TaxID=1871086 RepID=UPI002D538115|nr:ThiF family adenylyltransferase [Brevundimonas sp.]HYC97069.1 ThiF family adenylyltransferase [Brevundimonas sp.]
MSLRPIDRSPELKTLRDEGYDIEVVDGYLLLHDVPFINERSELGRGVLIAALRLNNDVALPPEDHQAKWAGDMPCNEDGSTMQGLGPSPTPMSIAGHSVQWNFSCKPALTGAYTGFHQKMTHYVDKISGAARALNPNLTAKTFRVRESNSEESVFLYEDTASSRADIVDINNKLKPLRVGVVGLGGTGSYVLDYLAKTPVREIHLFDGDAFEQHNAFRAPGAASGDELDEKLTKVELHARTYGKMRRGILVHPYAMGRETLHELHGLDFVFLCMEGAGKRPIVDELERLGIPFVDVGMGLTVRGDRLRGQIRTTTSTAAMRAHVHDKKRIAFTTAEGVNEYDKNIQVVELNGLNAALAVIKFKKLFGFYDDDGHEHSSVFVLSASETINEDIEE